MLIMVSLLYAHLHNNYNKWFSLDLSAALHIHPIYCGTTHQTRRTRFGPAIKWWLIWWFENTIRIFAGHAEHKEPIKCQLATKTHPNLAAGCCSDVLMAHHLSPPLPAHRLLASPCRTRFWWKSRRSASWSRRSPCPRSSASRQRSSKPAGQTSTSN